MLMQTIVQNNKSGINCIACGSSISRSGSDIYQCKNCSFLSSSFKPGFGTGVDGLEELRVSNFELLLDVIEDLAPLAGSHVLEIGCSKGWFLNAARARNAIVHGVEPEVINAEIARQSGHNVEIGLFPEFPKNKGPFDLIIFNDVFEHIPEPLEALVSVQSLLKQGGLVVFNIPSSYGTLYRIASLLNRIGISGPFDRLWQKGMASPHVSYFSPTTLKMFVENNSDMKLVGSSSLPSVSRSGLKERILSQQNGIPWQVSYAAIWALSFILPRMPADIHVGVFRKVGSN